MKTIELDMWDVKYIPSGHVVDTGTLGPCVGVIIYNPLGKEAYAGHFVAPSFNELEKMVEDALNTFQTPNNLEIYVAGNSADTLDAAQRAYELEVRGTIQRLLPKYGFTKEQIYIRWSPDSSCANLKLNVDTGKTLLEVFDFLDMIYKGEITTAPEEIVKRYEMLELYPDT